MDEEKFASDAEELKQQAKKRLDELRSLSFNVNSADPNNEFETIPAYLRRNLELYNSASSFAEELYSNYNLRTDSDDSLSLIFNLSEYDKNEIVGIISTLSELYTAIGGDQLKIRAINTFDLTPNEIPVLV